VSLLDDDDAGNPIKKPKSGYMLFCAQVRPQVSANMEAANGVKPKPTQARRPQKKKRRRVLLRR